jgi:hypothetical protein
MGVPVAKLTDLLFFENSVEVIADGPLRLARKWLAHFLVVTP